jgi:outer membrane protein assembly factor BamB
LTAAGDVVWHRTGDVAAEGVDLDRLDGGFDRILVDRGSAAHLSAASRQGLVARIGSSNGYLEPYADWGAYRGDAFMDGNGVVYYVQYLPQTGVRYWVRLDPRAGAVSQVPAGEELADFLARPVGVDDRGHAYGVAGMHMACMAEDGSPAWIFGCEGLVPGPGGELWTSVRRSEDGQAVVEVRSWPAGSGPGKPVKLVLPPGVDGGSWRLLRLDGRGYVVFGGETPTRSGAVVVFDEQGEAADVIDPAPSDVRLSGYWLQPPASWSIGLDGSVYLPVTGPDGLDVVRLTSG